MERDEQVCMLIAGSGPILPRLWWNQKAVGVSCCHAFGRPTIGEFLQALHLFADHANAHKQVSILVARREWWQQAGTALPSSISLLMGDK
jgi:hypothetical protein